MTDEEPLITESFTGPTPVVALAAMVSSPDAETSLSGSLTLMCIIKSPPVMNSPDCRPSVTLVVPAVFIPLAWIGNKALPVGASFEVSAVKSDSTPNGTG
jgi:hypothetical protein